MNNIHGHLISYSLDEEFPMKEVLVFIRIVKVLTCSNKFLEIMVTVFIVLFIEGDYSGNVNT